MAGGGGGAWKVAYADFVTAMMAFFMVMWLVNSKPEAAKAISDYFADPWAKYRINTNNVRQPTAFKSNSGHEANRKPNPGSRPKVAPHNEAEWPESEKPRIVTVRASERTTVGATVAFSNGSHELSEQAQLRLRKLVPQLQGLPHKIEIRGHVGTSMTQGSDASASAFQLSYQRSLAVLQFLESQGIDAQRMRMSQAGPHEPLTIESQGKADDKNSRVEVFLLAETVESFNGTKAQRAKIEKVDENQAQKWLEENDPASAAEAQAKSSHGKSGL
jgi:chemotaxis protein MotB